MKVRINPAAHAAAVSVMVFAGVLVASNAFAGAAKASDTMPGASMFGGPVYTGAPALPVTVALVKAGGGANGFSLVTALNHMLGAKTVDAEVKKLTAQYGKKHVGEWVSGINFAVNDTLKIAAHKGIELPPPAHLSGTKLAKTLVAAGTGPDHVFWAGYLFDHALSHGIHVQVMKDTNAKYGVAYDANYHKITNQAFYDVAQALGDKKVKLAAFH